MTANIRNEADRATLSSQGFTWATVFPRGGNKGQILSKHRTYAAADKAAKGLDRAIVEIGEGGSY
jgi:hypothetical protein